MKTAWSGLSDPMVKGLEYYAHVLAEGRVDPQWEPPRIGTQVALIERGLLTLAPHQLTGLGETACAELFPGFRTMVRTPMNPEKRHVEDLTIAQLLDTSVCGCPHHRVDSYYEQPAGCHHCGGNPSSGCRPDCPVAELDFRESEAKPGCVVVLAGRCPGDGSVVVEAISVRDALVNPEERPVKDLTIAELFDTSVCGCPNHRLDSFSVTGNCHHCGGALDTCCADDCPIGELDVRQSVLEPDSSEWLAIMYPEGDEP